MCWTLVYDTIYAHQVTESEPVCCCCLLLLSCLPESRLVLAGWLPGWLAGGAINYYAHPTPPLPLSPHSRQDKRDDARVGIRSTALTFGPRTKAYCSGFGAASVALLTAAGHAAGCGPAFYAGAAGAAAHLAWQIRTVDLDSGADCHAKFVSNAWYGALPFAGILADRLLQLA